MRKISTDDIMRATLAATDEAKAQALKILEGKLPPDAGTDSTLLRVSEAADLLNVSRATMWRVIRSGKLKRIELYPGSLRLRRSDVLKLVKGGDSC